ncbi:hypothetical protein MBLNU459_g3305t1 [Dothideomycetes sp. NU459]
MSESHLDDMSLFSFDHNCVEHPVPETMAPYDFAAISPTMSEHDMLFTKGDLDEHRPMHVNPAAMWNSTASDSQPADQPLHSKEGVHRVAGLEKLLTEYNGPVSQLFGQITPPDDKRAGELGTAADRCADSVTSIVTGSKRNSLKSNRPAPSKRASTTSRSSKRSTKLSHDSLEGSDLEEGDNKRGRYREKNRVAAAKCRAKKKEHVDHLEEDHRTGSVLNSALKQTEKSLRDELSFWRTQALQHSFCNCHSIQEYNMRKAQNLAAESTIGGNTDAKKKSSSATGNDSFLAASQAGSQSGRRGFRSQSMAGLGMSFVTGKDYQKSFDVASNLAVSHANNHSHGNGNSLGHARNASDSMVGGRVLSTMDEQELKNFVNDVTE